MGGLLGGHMDHGAQGHPLSAGSRKPLGWFLYSVPGEAMSQHLLAQRPCPSPLRCPVAAESPLPWTIQDPKWLSLVGLAKVEERSALKPVWAEHSLCP